MQKLGEWMAAAAHERMMAGPGARVKQALPGSLGNGT
jgi:hypothetical protein